MQPPALKHVAALDGLRGLAVALVMVFHLTAKWNNFYPGRVTLFLQQWLGWGWCGVNLFFVLSGFLITSILLETRYKPSYFGNFYGRRALRIFPLYFAVVFGLAVVSRLWHGSAILNEFQGVEWWFFTYTWNVLPVLAGGEWRSPLTEWLNHFWSLCVEEHFYLIWPLVVAVVPRLRLLLVVCSVGYLASVFCRTAFVWCGWTQAAYFTTPARVDALLLGAAAAVAWKSSLARPALNRAALSVLAIAGAAAVIGMCGNPSRHNLPCNLLWTSYGVDWCAAGLILLLVSAGKNSLALSLVAVQASGKTADSNVATISVGGGIFRNRVLVRLGVISYGVYILHMPIQQCFVQNVWPRLGLMSSFPSPVGFVIYAATTTALTLLAAELSWRFFESPILSLKEKWFGKMKPASLGEAQEKLV